MAIGVFTVDARGRFVAWSDRATRITGFPRDDVIGRPGSGLKGSNFAGFGSLLNRQQIVEALRI